MARDFDTFYSIGFLQPDGWEPGSEHDIEVEVDGRRRRLRYRESIRVPLPHEVEAQATVSALMYQAVDNPLGIRATPGSEVPRDDGTAALPVNLEIPVAKLGRVPADGVQAMSLSIYITVKDAAGNPAEYSASHFTSTYPTTRSRKRSASRPTTRYPWYFARATDRWRSVSATMSVARFRRSGWMLGSSRSLFECPVRRFVATGP
ncbi:MAG: hypothetical protein MPN21_19810 [Thermoanaerobaculia bacterium]|nr:hypothetical protein [Thermoanaerobaculia bacterium]